MSKYDDFVAELIRQAAALVPDPDPGREEVACPDCRTPRLVQTSHGDGGVLLGIGHDPGCPHLAGLVEAGTDHVIVDADHVIVHVINGEQRSEG